MGVGFALLAAVVAMSNSEEASTVGITITIGVPALVLIFLGVLDDSKGESSLREFLDEPIGAAVLGVLMLVASAVLVLWSDQLLARVGLWVALFPVVTVVLALSGILMLRVAVELHRSKTLAYRIED
jgi:hypothetical protein